MERARPAALRGRRSRVVPQVRDSGSRVHPGRLRRLPGEPPRRVFLQAPRLLPVVPRPPNGRLRRAPPRSRDAPRACAAVGLTVPFSLRFGLAFDPALAGTVLPAFVGVVSRWL